MLCCYVAKICRSSCGAPFFVGAPVRPNILNMPKFASASQSPQSELAALPMTL